MNERGKGEPEREKEQHERDFIRITLNLPFIQGALLQIHTGVSMGGEGRGGRCQAQGWSPACFLLVSSVAKV